MAYFVVSQFPGGLDLRKPEFAAAPGSASVATDVHLTRGNDFEIRKAFVSRYNLPAGTLGMATVKRQLYVFGSADTPAGLPGDFTYQRLQHPDALSLTRVLDWDAFNGKLYVAAQFEDGSIFHFYDGTIVAAWADQRARGSFVVSAGTASAGHNVSSIKIDGVEVLGSPVLWATSNSATAAAIAAQINSFASTPEYTAVASVSTVFVIAAASEGSAPNGRHLVAVVGGDVVISTVSDMDGGADTAGTSTPGPAVLTFKQKMHSVTSSLHAFSGVGDPTQLNPDDITSPGAGLTNLSNNASGSEELTGLGIYLQMLAIFADDVIQIWSVAADDVNDDLTQVISNNGTASARSIGQFQDTDVVYLDSSRGIRALHPSGTVANYAVIDEIGSAIDTLVALQMSMETDDTVQRAITWTEPLEGRLCTAIGSVIYVYTSFPQFKVAGWSQYLPGFVVEDVAVVGKKVHLRSGDTVYLYGGDDLSTYDATVPRLRLPAIVAQAPASFKDLIGIDVGVEGLWKITLFHSPTDTVGEPLLITNTFTYDKPSNPLAGEPTHPVLLLEGQGSGYRRFLNLALHFSRYDQE